MAESMGDFSIERGSVKIDRSPFGEIKKFFESKFKKKPETKTIIKDDGGTPIKKELGAEAVEVKKRVKKFGVEAKKNITSAISDLGLELEISDLDTKYSPLFKKEGEYKEHESYYGYVHDVVDSIKKGDYNHLAQSVSTDSSPSIRKETMVSALLAMKAVEKNTTDPESLGRSLDTTLLALRFAAPHLKMERSEVLAINSFLNEQKGKKYPGLSEFMRNELSNQTLQQLAANSAEIKTLINSHTSGNRLDYQDDKVKQFLDFTKITNNSDILFRVLAVSSPYTSSLGLSTVGQENLAKFSNNLSELLIKADKSISSPKMRDQAMSLILTQIYHCTGKIDEEMFTKCSPAVQDYLIKYHEFRSKQPLWKDRIEIFEKYPCNKTKELDRVVKDKSKKYVLAMDTRDSQLITFLDSGTYLSLFEAFRGNGSNESRVRTGHENRLFIQASGTPDDPYTRYGALKEYRSDKFTYNHYGEYSLILKDDVHGRTTGTDSDTFSVSYLPIPGKEKIDKMHQEKEIRGRYGYTEIQLHGGIKLSDVKLIVVNSNYVHVDSGMYLRIKEKAAEHGLEIILSSDIKEDNE